MAGSVSTETPQQNPARSAQQAAVARATANADSEGEAMVSQLVDQVLGQLDDGPFTEVEAPAAPVAAAQQPKPASPIEDFSDIFEETDRAATVDETPIEHDVDPFVAADEHRAAGRSEPEEDLQLITDPLKRSGTSGSSGESEAAGSGSFPSAPSDAKILEIPITVDADALKDGRPFKIVLTIRG
jgi:hypothetical protein